MGREVKRVPLDFDWPLNKVWKGFITPEKFDSLPCPDDCGGGWSWQYTRLKDLWYGYAPFDPVSTGSKPWTIETPKIRAMAERNVERAPDYYGTGLRAIRWEAHRLASLFNARWQHHLSQADVDLLVADGRLREFTHRFVSGEGWTLREDAEHPKAAEVNEWSLTGFGHGSSSAYCVIKARCERYCMPYLCKACDGKGGLEAYPGQEEERDAWEWEEPPTGEGYQLWETVSEGSPISPVFEKPDALARWMSSPDYVWGATKSELDRPSYDGALRWITNGGWAPSMVLSSKGLQDGVTAMSEGS